MENIGLRRHTVRLVDHDHGWQCIAKKIIRTLKNTSGTLVVGIEHVGSTSVEELPAKPIIDIAVAMESLDPLPELVRMYEGLGYIYRGDGGDDGGHLFVGESEPNVRTTHIHIVISGGIQWKNFLKFRDILRKNTKIRNQYKNLKEALSIQFKDDRRSYTASKDGFIRKVLKEENE